MPKKLEKALKKQAEKMGLIGDRRDKYIYGTMVKKGWRPKRNG